MANPPTFDIQQFQVLREYQGAAVRQSNDHPAFHFRPPDHLQGCDQSGAGRNAPGRERLDNDRVATMLTHEEPGTFEVSSAEE
jgi:hypothetical protein